MSSDGPTSVFEWSDTETDAIGWIVFDKVINGISGGGITMHKDATKQEVADIARNMSYKFTVTNPAIGGAKAGIRYDFTKPDAQDVLRRFIQFYKPLLQSTWVTAGDFGTDDGFIERTIQEMGLTCCQHALGKKVAQDLKSEDLSYQLAKLISHPANNSFPLIEACVGNGVAQSINMVSTISGMSKPRVMIQGFGAVGTSLAYYLMKENIATVVGIADQDGFVHCADGLPVFDFINQRDERKKQLEASGADKASIFQCAKTLMCNLTADQKVKYAAVYRNDLPSCSSPVAEEQQFLHAFLKSESAEVISLCAGRYAFTKGTMDAAVSGCWKNTTLRFLVSGANNIFGLVNEHGQLVEDKAKEVMSALQSQHRVCIVPDWVANSGTAQLFHRGLSVKFDLEASDLAQRVLDTTAAPIKTYILDTFSHCKKDLTLMATKCYTLAERRMKAPRPIEPEPKAVSALPFRRTRYGLAPRIDQLPFEERFKLVQSVGEEIVDMDELRVLLQNNAAPVCYDGFEPSGRMHIAQGIMKKVIVDKLTKAGFTYLFWVADWFAMMNHKMGGDLGKIKDVGRYFIEIWKALGMDMSRVKFLWASEEISKYGDDYWSIVLEMATKNSLDRVLRCLPIMGRQEGKDTISSSQILYAVMQCADIFFLDVDCTQLGLDQRRVNVMGREFAERTDRTKPIIISHHMLSGLKKNQEKMSKSDPESAIFMEDSAEDVARKIKSAYCSPGEIAGNPVLEYYKYIVFPSYDDKIVIQTAIGAVEYSGYASLEAAFEGQQVHPKELKDALTKYINELIEPVRRHFAENKEARDLVQRVRSYQVTR